MDACKICIGPMTKHVVDAVIEFANEKNVALGFIPSRRQIEYDPSGYTGFTTQSFSKYVRERTENVFIERDHGGAQQGSGSDSGFASFTADAKYFDIIHIDVWKQHTDLYKCIDKTVEFINYIYLKNPNVFYEIGTEEAIKRLDPWEIDIILKKLKERLSPEKFNNILYVVVQSGTALFKNTNVGIYDESRLKDMIDIVKNYNKKTKCHNGDYLTFEQIKHKFKLGLDCINVAPEAGLANTEVLLDVFDKYEKELLFNSCLNSGKWKKWVDPEYDPYANQEELIKICGHYVANNEEVKAITNKYTEIYKLVKENVYNKLSGILDIK